MISANATESPNGKYALNVCLKYAFDIVPVGAVVTRKEEYHDCRVGLSTVYFK